MSNTRYSNPHQTGREDSTENNISRRNVVTAAAATTAAAAGATAFSGQAEAQETSGEFAGKTAFITGGARGIGRACAEALAAGGANIVLFDVASQIREVPYPLATAADLAEAKAAIEAMGVGCLAVKGDVRDFKAQKNAIDKGISEFGSLDFAVANAGITQIGQMESFDENELSLIIDINLKGVIKTIQAATPIMRAQNSGRIVLMSSVTGRSGSANFPIYSATKWATIGLAKSTALALGKSNVTCNAVCPTLVHTKLLDNEYILSQIAGQPVTFEQFNEGAKGRHVLPVGLYEPSRVGDTVRFLCSDAAALISGDVFDIGAGLNAQFPA